ncbi:guanine nucleotide-binding protein g(o) subunit alpha [Anaeramoeba flamelloides]|uniref:Guanine nucleotide-binding protein g(O) subunit alpha n=1 Tax=Anaeramoeba flamelloides TaxID=1746091 RepID=A0AAV7YF68_9EUKA|nr:guanine nucleotide-binding protein g(o) subunit alpha [Anaeramoeba flamelloides]
MCGCQPTKLEDIERKMSKSIDNKMSQQEIRQEEVIQILLLGPGESGKSTIIKQIKQIFLGGFKKREIKKYRESVYSNVVEAIQTLIRGTKKFDFKLSNKKSIRFSKQLLKLPFNIRLTEEICKKIAFVYNDPVIQKVLLRGKEIQLIESAKYFLDRVELIGDQKYTPTTKDIYKTRVRSTGISETLFAFQETKFRIIDVGGQRNERKKWIHCFENISVVIFVAAISEYDQTLFEETNTNRMTECLMLWKEITNSRWLQNAFEILFLNKVDIFEEKIKSEPLGDWFDDYEGGTDPEKAKIFLLNKFLALNENPDKNLFTFFTIAINKDSIKNVFVSMKHSLKERKIDEIGFI